MIIKIAIRNLLRQKRRTFLSGLMLTGGFFLTSISIGFMEGTYGVVIDAFTRGNIGHVQIHHEDYLEDRGFFQFIPNAADVKTSVSSHPRIKAWAPRMYGSALAFTGKKSFGVQLVGIDPEKEFSATSLKNRIAEGQLDEKANSILIDRRVARILKIEIGDEVAMISQAADGGIANELFNVTGIVGKKNDTTGMNVYMTQASMSEFLYLGDRIHEIVVILDSYKESRTFAAAMNQNKTENGIKVSPWQEVEPQFEHAMETDKSGNVISMIVIMIMIGVGILNSVLMNVLERTREFGVLRAIGTRPGTIVLTVVIETFFLGVLCCIVGAVLSTAFNGYFAVYGIQISEAFEMGGFTMSEMRTAITPESYTTPTILILFVAVLVSLMPAIRAARVTPATAMRFD
jgi:ABC-type lipoprotein release transport system permease subunit